MQQKKRIITALLVLALCATLVCLITSCNKTPQLSVSFDSTHKVYEDDTLDSLKTHLTVKYTNEKGSETTVNDYTLAGTLSVGQCAVVVSYKGLEKSVLITVLARQEATKYTVTFKADGVTVGTKTFTADNKNITEPQVPAKTGYIGKWEDYTLGDSDITVNAVYTAKTYTVMLDYDGATGNNTQQSITVTYNKEIGALPTPTKSGYIFGGWYFNGAKVNSDTVWSLDLSGQLTFVARWETDTPSTDKGTYYNPYLVDEAVELINSLSSGQHTDKPVYVLGAVSSNSTTGSEGDLLFYITDEDMQEQLYIYYASCNISGVDSVKVGDIVLVYGYLCNYNGNTPEMKKNNNLKPEIVWYFDGSEQTPDKGTLDNPYTVAEALEITNALDSDQCTDSPVYVKGIVSQNSTQGNEGDLLFYIADEYSQEQLYIYYATCTVSGVDSVKVGDVVVVYGYLCNFRGNTPEMKKNNNIKPQIVKINEDGDGNDGDVERIYISASSQSVAVGYAAELYATTVPFNYADYVVFYIKQGSQFGYISDNIFYAESVGECVIVGRIGDVYSNELIINVTVTVSGDITITLSVNKTFIEKNNYTDMTVTVSPSSYEDMVQYRFIQGSECVTRYGRSLMATSSGIVKIQAFIGDNVSNIVSFQIVDPDEDPYTNVTSGWFYNNYNPATSLEDAYWRTQHNLMSGSIVDQDQKPTTATNQPKSGNMFVRNSDSNYIDNGNTWEVVDSSGNVVNKIYKFGAYVTLEEVAAYVYAFGDVPANYTSSNSTSSLNGSPWGKFLRLNHVYFSGDTSRFPYEPLLPRISGEGGDLDYYEIDIGTTGTDCDPNYDSVIYNNGDRIVRGAARIVYTRYYSSGGHIDDLDERYVFYTYNHYNDFQEYLNYQGGWGKMFGNITGGGTISSKSDYNPTPYVEVSRQSFGSLFN